LYEEFFKLNQKHPIKGGFKANVLPGIHSYNFPLSYYSNLEDFYEEHLRIDVPEVHQLWFDRDLFLAFREYLYQQYAAENLSFYLQLGIF
jgi:hypothetical protein